MCGRFDNHLPKMIGWADALRDWPDVPLSYNVAPSTQIAAFTGSSENPDMLQGSAMRWGMVPGWAKEFGSKYATFNARVETVADKPTFRNAWKRQQRCLIPMSGYYEWQTISGVKQPFFITDRNVGGLMAAGLYEAWSPSKTPAGNLDEESAVLHSCTMITRAADAGLDRIHHRMPILLKPDTAEQWLYGSPQQDFLLQCEAPEVVYWPVDKAVGNVRNDHERLSEPVDTEQSQ